MTEYHLTDALGSVRQLADAGGSVQLAQTFDPYGNLYAQSGGSRPSFGWTGEQSDPNGLTYLRARYYNPAQGRFTQLDPFAGALVMPASMNGYGYVHGNPVRYTDPSGELVLLTALLVGALIGGALGFGITYGTELYAHRSIIEKEGFWAVQKHLDWGRIGVATAIGAVSGALGYGAGWAATAGMYEVAAGLYAANLAFDIGTDMGVYGDTFLDAYTANMAFAMFDMPGPGDEMLFKAAAHGFADDAGEVALHNAVRRNPMASQVLANGGGSAAGTPNTKWALTHGGGGPNNDPTLFYGTNRGYGKTTENAIKLRENMGAVGKPGQAHHIVSSTSQNPYARHSRELLEQFGIDINQMDNGVLLPGAIHSGLGKDAIYIKAVDAALSGAVDDAYAKAILKPVFRTFRI